MLFSILLLCVVFGSFPGKAIAIPALQIYIEGGDYTPKNDPEDPETWLTTSPTFKLWVLGDVGQYGTISNVFLSAAFSSKETGTITITPTTATAGLLPTPGDPSTPGSPVYSGSGIGTAPLMGDGNPLPSHDIYGGGTSWNSYALGDFSLTDSFIGDYNGSIPTSFPDKGQINAYEVTVSGYSWIHFDAFDHYINGNHSKYVKAPSSHDGGSTPVPEPGTLLLLGSGFTGLALLGRRRATG